MNPNLYDPFNMKDGYKAPESSVDEPLCQLKDLEITLMDASPEELPGLHAKLEALVDGLPDAIMHLITNRIEATKPDQNTLLLSDLAWCIGKLRGLGHPNEAMEKRWKLAQSTNKQESK